MLCNYLGWILWCKIGRLWQCLMNEEVGTLTIHFLFYFYLDNILYKFELSSHRSYDKQDFGSIGLEREKVREIDLGITFRPP